MTDASSTFDRDKLHRGSEYIYDVSHDVSGSTHDANHRATYLTYEEVIDRLEALGSSTTDGRQWCCPAHDDHNPSLAVTETDDGGVLLHCFAGCEFDEIMDRLREVDLTRSFVRDPRQKTERTKKAKPIPSEQELSKRRKALHGDRVHRAVLNAEEHRKISFATLDRFKVGVHERSELDCLSLEVQEVREERQRDWDSSDPHATITRSETKTVGVMSIDPRPSKVVDGIAKLALGERGLYPAPERFKSSKEIVIVEGELDALAICSLGIDAVGAPGANTSASTWEKWAPRFERFDRVTVVFDCDGPGRKCAQRVAQALSKVTDVRILDLDPTLDLDLAVAPESRRLQ